MRRGQLIALTLLVLALPTAALADSINFKISPAQFHGGSIRAAFGSPWAATVISDVPTNLRIQVFPVTFTPSTCAPVGATCAFTGTVTVTNRADTVTLFTSSLFDGELTRISSTEVTLSARLSKFPKFGFVHMDFTTNGSSHMLSGSAQVATPEPSTLLSLGTGLIGLAGMMKRKLKLRT